MSFWLARIFGKRFEGIDWHNGTHTKVIGYKWRGNLYVTRTEECGCQSYRVQERS